MSLMALIDIVFTFTGKFVSASVLALSRESSAARAAELWSSSGLRWEQFLEKGADADKFVKDNVSDTQ